MTKRVICFILIFTLAGTFMPLAFATEVTESPFEFWTIPFGCEPEEFIRLGYEKSGFLFSPATIDDFPLADFFGVQKNSRILSVDTKKQNISMLGYSIDNAAAAFNSSSNGFCRLLFTFSKTGDEKNLNERRCADLFKALSEKYGEPTYGVFSFFDNSGQRIDFDLPIKNKMIDIETLIKVRENNDFPTLTLVWRNIIFYAYGYFAPRLVIFDSSKTFTDDEPSNGYYSAPVSIPEKSTTPPMTIQDSDAGI